MVATHYLFIFKKFGRTVSLRCWCYEMLLPKFAPHHRGLPILLQHSRASFEMFSMVIMMRFLRYFSSQKLLARTTRGKWSWLWLIFKDCGNSLLTFDRSLALLMKLPAKFLILVMFRPSCMMDPVSSVCSSSNSYTVLGPTCFLPMMPLWKLPAAAAFKSPGRLWTLQKKLFFFRFFYPLFIYKQKLLFFAFTSS